MTSGPRNPVLGQRIVAVVVALSFVTLWHLFLGDMHFNPAEEGYLWYGVWRTGEGELPVRDFQSYDVGRYWACSALSPLFGQGLLGLRRSLAAIQGLGLCLGLLAARRALRSAWPLIPIGILLGLWMFPRQKVFEPALAMAAVWVGVVLLERPTRLAHLGAGAFVGLAGVIGCNHGIYSGLGLLALVVLALVKNRDLRWKEKLLSWGSGVILGYSPMLGLLLLAPGFAASYERFLMLLKRVGPNLEHPWLWPWRLELEGLNTYLVLVQVCLASLYLLPLLVLPAGWVVALRTRAGDLPRRALLVAGTVLGSFYVHHAAVRSDAAHLAQCIHPVFLALLGGAALAGDRLRVPARAALAGLGLFCTGLPVREYNPQLNSLGPVVPVELAGERLRMLPQHAWYYEQLQRAIRGRVGPEDSLFVAPARAGYYPLFSKVSPSWWIYFVSSEPDDALQLEVVDDLQGVDWVLIVDIPIGGQEELRFRNSSPRVWAHLLAEYERVPTPGLPPDHLLFRRER